MAPNEGCNHPRDNYPDATYCGFCGSWLAPEGWGMLGGDPGRTGSRVFNSETNRLQPWFDNLPDPPHSSLISTSQHLVLCEDQSAVFRDVKEINLVKKRYRFPNFPAFTSTPCFVRPFVYFIEVGCARVVHVNLTWEEPFTILEDPRIRPSPSATALGVDLPAQKIVVFPLEKSILIIEDHQKGTASERFKLRFIQVELANEETLNSPALWQDLLVFTTNRGGWFAISIEDSCTTVSSAGIHYVDQLVAFSCPSVFQKFVIFEGVGLDGLAPHRVYRLDLVQKTLSYVDIPHDGVRRQTNRLQYSLPISFHARSTVCSSLDLNHLYGIDLEAFDRPILLQTDQNQNILHWKSTFLTSDLLTVPHNSNGLVAFNITSGAFRSLKELPNVDRLVCQPIVVSDSILLLFENRLCRLFSREEIP